MALGESRTGGSVERIAAFSKVPERERGKLTFSIRVKHSMSRRFHCFSRIVSSRPSAPTAPREPGAESAAEQKADPVHRCTAEQQVNT